MHIIHITHTILYVAEICNSYHLLDNSLASVFNQSMGSHGEFNARGGYSKEQ